MSAAAPRSRWSRIVPPRPARVIVAAALGLGLAGGVTGAALGGVGSMVSSEAVHEHSEHAAGVEGHEHGFPGDGDDLPAPVPAPVPAPAPGGP